MKRTIIAVAIITLLAGDALSFGWWRKADKDSPISQGWKIIGGQVSFASYQGDLYEEDGDPMTIFTLSPTFYYFAVNGLALGLDLGYTSMSQGEWSSSALNIGPAVSFFVSPGSELKNYPYLGLSYTFDSYRSEYGSDEAKHSGSTFTIKGGIMVMMGEHLALTPEVSYNLVSYKPDYPGAEEMDGLILMVSIGLAGFIK